MIAKSRSTWAFYFCLAVLYFAACASAKELFRDDFKNLAQWEIHDYPRVEQGQHSDWRVADGKVFNPAVIRNTSEDRNARGIFFGSNLIARNSFGDGILRVLVEETDFHVRYGVIFRYTDENNYYRLDFNDDLSNLIVLKNGEVKKVPLPENFCYVPPHQVTCVDLECRGPEFTVSINGIKRLAFKDTTFAAGRFGFFSANEHPYKNGFTVSRVSITDTLPAQLPPEVKMAVVKKPFLYWCMGPEARVVWETTFPGRDNVVEYGLEGKLTHKVSASTKILVHSATLVNLEPGVIYSYRCQTDGIVAGEGTFRSDPGPGSKETIRLGLIGDNQSNPQYFSKLNGFMAARKPDLVFNVGDTVVSGSRSNWNDEFFDPVAGRAPYLISIGNHERKSKYFSYYHPYPETNNVRGHYYAGRYGGLAFLAFDDCILSPEQSAWMAKTLASPMFQTADWRIVFSHMPPQSVGWKTNEGEKWKRGPEFMGLLKKYRVDFLFNGHTHSYERGIIDGTYHIISGGGGGGDENFGRCLDETAVFTLDLHYCLLEFQPGRVELKSYDLENRPLDRLVVVRGRPLELDATPVLLGKPVRKGQTLTFAVSTPALALLKTPLRYKITFDPDVNTYQWTEAKPGSEKVELAIKPTQPKKYRVRIVAMDDEGRLIKPLIHEIEWPPKP